MADKQVIFPCSVNSVPFYPSVSNRRSVDAYENYGQASYFDSLIYWQTKLPYAYNALMQDRMTFQFKTQTNGTITLKICESKIGANGLPTCGNALFNIVAGVSPVLGYWGFQIAPYDIYTDPITNYSQPLTTLMWTFALNDFLTDSGLYFLQLENNMGGNILTFTSEPILVYGDDAVKYCPNTLLFEAKSNTNKSDYIIDGWFYTVDQKYPVFRTRVLGDILEFGMKGVHLGFLRDNFNQVATYDQSWNTWVLNVGSNRNGIPPASLEIAAKIMELDIVSINNNYYTYDLGESSSDSPTSIWKIKSSRVKGLLHATLPVRNKFSNQLFAESISEFDRIFTEEFSDEFS